MTWKSSEVPDFHVEKAGAVLKRNDALDGISNILLPSET